MAHFLAYTTVPAISIAAHTLDSAVQHILLTHLAATLYMVHPTPSSRPLLCLYHKSNVRVEIRRLLQLQAYQILLAIYFFLVILLPVVLMVVLHQQEVEHFGQAVIHMVGSI